MIYIMVVVYNSIHWCYCCYRNYNILVMSYDYLMFSDLRKLPMIWTSWQMWQVGYLFNVFCDDYKSNYFT